MSRQPFTKIILPLVGAGAVIVITVVGFLLYASNFRQSPTASSSVRDTLMRGYEKQSLPADFSLTGKTWLPNENRGSWHYTYQAQLPGPKAVQELATTFTGNGYQDPANEPQNQASPANFVRDNILYDGTLNVAVVDSPASQFASGPVTISIIIRSLGSTK